MFATQFEQEEQSFRTKKTSVAAIATVLFHALILLFLMFRILHEPDPPLESISGGMTVNFGTDDAGTGNEQPFTYNPGQTASSASTAESQPQPTEAAPEKLLTQDNEETNVAAPKADDKPKPKVNDKAVLKRHPKTTTVATTESPKSTPAPVPVEQPKPNANAMFSKGAYGKPNGSKSDGTGGGNGDQGKPNGDVNSKNYLGDGSGNSEGPGHGDLKGGYSLRGRKNTSRPEPCACNTQGRVVIAIKVDRTGKVIDAQFKRFSSTSVEDCNINCAIIAARKATFNPDPNAPEVQEGTITYVNEVH